MWRRVRKYLEDLKSVGTCADGQELPEFIPENIFYRLAMKAKNETAERFQAKVADEIIPSIRKTGYYGKHKQETVLSVGDAFRLMELVNDTPADKLPIVRAIFSQAGVTIPETDNHWNYSQKKCDMDRKSPTYSSSDNYVNTFLKGVNVINRPTNDVYAEYTEYCSANGIDPVSNIEFSKIVNKALGMRVKQKKINNVNRRIFVQGKR